MPMAATAKRWTLDELHRLPDDGNKYEVVFGELYVTPAPTEEHETILARLTALLQPYVHQHQLGAIFHPRAVIRFDGSEVEPDLFVRALRPRTGADWEDAPAPSLVVEVLSPATRRRELTTKREFYLAVGAGDYWIIDPESRTVRSIQAGRVDVVSGRSAEWAPVPQTAPLLLDVAALFDDAAGKP